MNLSELTDKKLQDLFLDSRTDQHMKNQCLMESWNRTVKRYQKNKERMEIESHHRPVNSKQQESISF